MEMRSQPAKSDVKSEKQNGENRLFTLFEGKGVTGEEDAGPTLQLDLTTGRMLAEARQRLKMSVKDVADALRLSEEFVRAIEKRDYQMLPSAAYATGYVRAYANLVKLNADQLVRADPELGLKAIDLEVNTDLNLASTTTARVLDQFAPHSWSWFPTAVKITAILVVLGGLVAGWNYRSEISVWWSEKVKQEQINSPHGSNDSQIMGPNQRHPTRLS